MTDIDKIKKHLDTAERYKWHPDAYLHHLIKAYEEIESLIRNSDEKRFGIRTATCLHTPQISVSTLNVCDICGMPGCGSDHK